VSIIIVAVLPEAALGQNPNDVETVEGRDQRESIDIVMIAGTINGTVIRRKNASSGSRHPSMPLIDRGIDWIAARK
jgi:hypothetical protein